MNPLFDLVEQNIEISPQTKAIPIVHGSLEFTLLIRKFFYDNQPDLVAIEAPVFLQEKIDTILPNLDSYPVIKFNGEITNYFIFEPLEPIVEAIRNCNEFNIPFYLIDQPPLNSKFTLSYKNFDDFPDTFILNFLSLKEIYKIYIENSKIKSHPIDLLRELYMTIQIKKLEIENQNKQIVLICGFKHLKNIKYFYKNNLKKLEELFQQLYRKFELAENKKIHIEIFSLSNSSPEVLSQPGFYNDIWLQYRDNPKQWKLLNRIRLQRDVYRLSKIEYEKQSGEFIPPQKEKLIFQFSRNLSLLYKKLLPNPLILIHSVKGFINDNFARIFYEILMTFNKKNSPFEEIKISLEEMNLDSEIIRFRIKLFREQNKTFQQLKSKTTKEDFEGQWKTLWNREGICSYPPEDFIIENFCLELRKKALDIVKSLEKKIHPFTSSLLDGIDYRETIRNYYKNTIYVIEEIHKDWDAGNVVIIFNEDENYYSWKNVWWGEHSQEGDMAFYSTPPEDMIIGPGIARCIYGGFLISYPPRRLTFIWDDYELRNFRSAKEKLLSAGILFNQKNSVVYIAEKPQSPKMNYFASRFGQKIIYIPIRTINQQKLNRIRRFHVLSGHDRRKDADKYIW